jgi:hypothetical protein
MNSRTAANSTAVPGLAADLLRAGDPAAGGAQALPPVRDPWLRETMA